MSERMVAVDDVMRGGAVIVGALSVMSLAATFLSGAIIIQPLIAILLLIASAGFWVMAEMPSRKSDTS